MALIKSIICLEIYWLYFVGDYFIKLFVYKKNYPCCWFRINWRIEGWFQQQEYSCLAHRAKPSRQWQARLHTVGLRLVKGQRPEDSLLCGDGQRTAYSAVPMSRRMVSVTYRTRQSCRKSRYGQEPLTAGGGMHRQRRQRRWCMMIFFSSHKCNKSFNFSKQNSLYGQTFYSFCNFSKYNGNYVISFASFVNIKALM